MMLTKFINASLGFATRAERGRAVFLGGRSPDFAEEILRLRNERHQVAPKTSALDAGGDRRNSAVNTAQSSSNHYVANVFNHECNRVSTERVGAEA